MDVINRRCFLLSAAVLLGGPLGCVNTASRSMHLDSANVEYFRYARIQDLELSIEEIKPGPDGFPIVLAYLSNRTNDAIIVPYFQDSINIHCGSYIQTRPPGVADLRREILDGYGYMDFVLPSGGWRKQAGSGSMELMVPDHLEPGSYQVWATFKLAVPKGGTVETSHQTFAAAKSTP